jgi:Tol biopolymer transport system component
MVAVVASALAAPAQATFPGKNGLIAYERMGLDNRSHGIWAVDETSGTKHRLIGGDVYDPAWSPNGRLIAYRQRGRSQGVFVARADGSEPRRITNQQDKHPAFSPTGKRIAFDRYTTGHGFDIVSMRLDGSRVRRVASGRDPVYSPDGRWIAYMSGGTGRAPTATSIHVTRPTGADARTIFTSDSDDFISDLDWSPDSARIAFHSFKLGLVTMDAEGANRKSIGPYASPISYSPNGRFIAFPGSSSGGDTIEAAPSGGGASSTVAHVSTAIGGLAWQPRPH